MIRRIILQARMSSSRLPGKSLMTMGGIPLALLVARRAGNSGHEVVVATSHEKSDDPLARELERSDIKVVRGPLNDVLSRFVIAAEDLSDDSWVVRITGDNPIPDGELIGMVEATISDRPELDYVRTPDAHLPYGVCVEAFKAGSLRKVDAEIGPGIGFEREHVTPWMIDNLETGVMECEDVPVEWGRLRATCDTPGDYTRLLKVIPSDPIKAERISWKALCEKLSVVSEEEPALPQIMSQGSALPYLCFGTAQAGGIDYGVVNSEKGVDVDRDRSLIEFAWESGCRFFDTASGYGKAERRLGEVLGRKQGSEEFSVTTKVGLSEGGALEDAVLEVDNQIFGSLASLQLSSIGTVLLHQFTHFDAGRSPLWSRLSELKELGLIQKIGVSVYTPEEAMACLEVSEVDAIQIPFNLADHRWLAPELVERLEKVHVMVRSVFLQGLLVTPFENWPQSMKNEVFEGTQLELCLKQLADDFGRKDPVDRCLSWVKSFPWIDEVIVGADTPQQIAETFRNFKASVPFTPDEISRIGQLMAGQVAASLVDPRSWS